MENEEVKALIAAFTEYRDLLVPIQSNLHDFADTYDSMKNDIEKLNSAFGSDIKSNLEEIYNNLSKQAEHAADLSSRIDQFVKTTAKYTSDFSRLISMLEKAADKLQGVNDLEARAEEQIGKLDSILEEKKKSYNIKELQRSLESYNDNVKKVSEFINVEVAETLSKSSGELSAIKSGGEAVTKQIEAEHSDLQSLLGASLETNKLLKKIVENEDVNEAYIFDIIDKWAKTRKVKTKKQDD